MTDRDEAGVLACLDKVIEARKTEAADASYVASLFAAGRDAILKKIGEEATEVVLAGKQPELQPLINEVSDLCFHTLVLLHDAGADSTAVLRELERRFGTSGLVEKAARDEAD